MSKKKDNISKSNPTYEVVKKIRGDWGAISPVTKIIPNKKKNHKVKHKGNSMKKIKQTDGTHCGVTIFCPVNGWACPYWINHVCFRRNPMVNCEDFQRIYKSWEYWEAL